MEAPVFQLSLVDHIRLSFGSVATSYRAHARAAERLSGRAWQSRVVLVTLLGLSTGASLVALTGARPFQIAAAALSRRRRSSAWRLCIARLRGARLRASRLRRAALAALRKVPRPPRRRPRRPDRPARHDRAPRRTSCAKSRTSTSTRFLPIARPIRSRGRRSAPAPARRPIRTSIGFCPPLSARQPASRRRNRH